MPSVAPDEADELIGSLVDERYKVLEAMASGSMGAVYKAERVPVGKLVAIKFLHAAFANDSEFLSRFERETRVMSKLAHPNCVSVVDFGVFEGSPYLVMDYVAGTTLRSLIDLGPLAPARALAITRQISAGLAHAHTQGVVHRDVKPANIMISEEIGTGEHVRILDFGLARLRGAVGRDATQSNVVVGTPNYMAPEQTVGGGTIDARTDVYAVGVVLFEMIAGVRPFQAEDTLALLGMHRAAPIPKLADRLKEKTTLPDGLQQVIEKAMAKSPDDRFQSAIELAEAIDAVSGARSVEGRVPVVARKADPLGIAPTMQVDVGRERAAAAKPQPKKSGSSVVGAVLAVIVLGGGAAAAWYIKGRDAGHVATGSAPDNRVPLGSMVDSSMPIAELPQDAATPVVVGFDSAPVVDDAAIAVGSGSAVDGGEVAVGSGSDTEPGSGSNLTVGSGSGSDTGEIDMAPDPLSAENLAPKSTVEPEDEAPDAPKTTDDVEKHAPIAPVLATTIAHAVQLIKEGKTDLAVASLRALWKKTPRSAYIPFLLGNLYFDKRWWSVAMDHYRASIAKNAGYKNNATLNRNIIRMLASKKTAGSAEYFLRKTIGRQSVPYLRYAAQHESSAYVKRYAAALAKAIGGR